MRYVFFDEYMNTFDASTMPTPTYKCDIKSWRGIKYLEMENVAAKCVPRRVPSYPCNNDR